MYFDLALTFAAIFLFFVVMMVVYPDEMRDIAWKLIAEFVCQPPVAGYLIARAQRTPYTHLPGYMDRFWLFNRYELEPDPTTGERRYPKRNKLLRWLPSIRIHHILRRDLDPAPHDHPWDARTIILRGAYNEVRGKDPANQQHYFRSPGDTAELKFGEFHNITHVTPGGVWTIFITYGYRGKWGFWKDGRKIPYDQYADLQKRVDPEA